VKSSGISFNPKRLVQLSRIAIADDWRPFLLTGLVMSGLVFITGVLFKPQGVGFLFGVMLLVGVVLVSKLFVGIHQKEKGIYFHMLPASVEEKFFLQLLASLIGYFFYAVITIAAGAVIFNLIGNVSGNSKGYVTIFPHDLWSAFQVYFFFHAIFFAGALWFRRNNFLKTTLVLISGFIIVIFVTAVYLKKTIVSLGQTNIVVQFNSLDQLGRFFGSPVFSPTYFLYVFLVVIVPLFLYGISYYEFKNYQVKG
jgi:hypothetical protein